MSRQRNAALSLVLALAAGGASAQPVPDTEETAADREDRELGEALRRNAREKEQSERAAVYNALANMGPYLPSGGAPETAPSRLAAAVSEDGRVITFPSGNVSVQNPDGSWSIPASAMNSPEYQDYQSRRVKQANAKPDAPAKRAPPVPAPPAQDGADQGYAQGYGIGEQFFRGRDAGASGRVTAGAAQAAVEAEIAARRGSSDLGGGYSFLRHERFARGEGPAVRDLTDAAKGARAAAQAAGTAGAKTDDGGLAPERGIRATANR